MACPDARMLKENSATAAPAMATAPEKGTTSSGHDLPVAVEHEEVDCDENPAPAAEEEKKWRVPQEHIDFILSWDVGGDVSPNMERIERLPVSEKKKAVYRAGELQGVAALNKLRQIRRETQQWVRDQYDKHGYVLVDERHLIDVNLARFGSGCSQR